MAADAAWHVAVVVEAGPHGQVLVRGDRRRFASSAACRLRSCFVFGSEGDLARQKLRLFEHAQREGWLLDGVIEEVGSALNGTRRKLLKVLANPSLGWLVVEHRDRLARFGFEMVEAVLRARGGGVVVIEDREVDDDLVRDMTEVLTSMCARLYGRRSARRRAERALQAAAS